MKLDYESKKWIKEIDKFNKSNKEVGGRFNKGELATIDEFLESQNKDYLRLYSRLFGRYKIVARNLYLQNKNNKKCKDYSYLSGKALILTKQMYEQGIKTRNNEIVEDCIDWIDYAFYQMIACDEINIPYLQEDDNNLISLVLHQKYEKAKEILCELPDDVDDSNEVYYICPEFLKKIYLAIINGDEKAFNEELAKRIKKYRRNMVGYSTIIDIVSIALIKMAKLAGIKCTVDVIEIPKMFFDESYVIDKETIKLPFYDEFLELGLVDM